MTLIVGKRFSPINVRRGETTDLIPSLSIKISTIGQSQPAFDRDTLPLLYILLM